MKILHVIPSIALETGGPAVALAGLIKAQVAIGNEVSVFTTFEGDNDTLSAAFDSIPVTVVGPVRGPLKSHKDLYRLLSREVDRVDLVHLHGLWEDVLYQATRAAKKAKRPYILRPCGMLDPWSLQQGYWKKRFYMALRLKTMLRDARAIHFTTPEERELAKEVVPHSRFVTMPNGLTLDAMPSKAPPAYSVGKGNVLFLSRLHPKKGLELLIPAFDRVCKEDERLWIAGPGEPEYLKQIQDLIAQCPHRDQISLLGMLEGSEKSQAFSLADLFVLPSYQENFGNVVIESLTQGTPVLLGEGVNLAPWVDRAGVGRVCTTTIESVATSLRDCLDDDSWRAIATKRAPHFAARFSWDRIAARWLSIYTRLID